MQTVEPRGRRIVLAHGGGGQLTDELLAGIIRPRVDNPILSEMDDSAVVSVPASRLAFTTDSYVVRPLEFPGGDIGRLAVCGTVNDLAVSGAEPIGISLSLILEEGLELERLERILDSVGRTAQEAGVQILTGDTKVVARSQADGIYINTAGIGIVRAAEPLSVRRIQPGDVVLLNGPIAEHGLAVMLSRETDLGFSTELVSDVAPLNGLLLPLVEQVGDGLLFMRDPTRGGLAGVLAELAERTRLRLVCDETKIPIRAETRYAAELLGLDPLEVANEGKVVVVVRPEAVDRTLKLLRQHPLGRQATVIGEFQDETDGICELVTRVGGRRIIQKPYGEQLPRIC